MKFRSGTFPMLGAFVLVVAAATGMAQTGSGTDHDLRADASAPSATSGTGSVQSGHDSHYVIGSDDVLSINVWKEPDLTQKEVPVRSDGRISMPLIGEVTAAGLTPLQLERDLTTRLRAFLTVPDVTVMVVQMNSQKYNVLGRVKKPGSYKLAGTTTVLDGIAQAGGFEDFAKEKAVYVLRQNPGGGETRIPFNYKSVVRGEHPEQNVRLEPNDTIVVP